MGEAGSGQVSDKVVGIVAALDRLDIIGQPSDGPVEDVNTGGDRVLGCPPSSSPAKGITGSAPEQKMGPKIQRPSIGVRRFFFGGPVDFDIRGITVNGGHFFQQGGPS